MGQKALIGTQFLRGYKMVVSFSPGKPVTFTKISNIKTLLFKLADILKYRLT